MVPTESVPLAVLTGLVGGAVHVLTGPDHLAAVLPFASGARRRAAAVGLAWGAGHSIGVLLLGLAALLLEGALDLDGVSAFAERTVGFLLIGLGLWTLRRARLLVVHEHAHVHPPHPRAASSRDPEGSADHREPVTHAHAHVHIADATVGAEDHAERGAHGGHRHSALAFGVVHGVAGTSHLFGVLPAILLGTGPAVGYLAAFLLGSAGAMAGFAALAGGLVAGHAGRLRFGLQASGVFAVAVGGFWIAQTFA